MWNRYTHNPYDPADPHDDYRRRLGDAARMMAQELSTGGTPFPSFKAHKILVAYLAYLNNKTKTNWKVVRFEMAPWTPIRTEAEMAGAADAAARRAGLLT